jgi:hypothetical protein
VDEGRNEVERRVTEEQRDGCNGVNEDSGPHVNETRLAAKCCGGPRCDALEKKRDFSLRKPSASQEVKREERASACSGRNDGVVGRADRDACATKKGTDP